MALPWETKQPGRPKTDNFQNLKTDVENITCGYCGNVWKTKNEGNANRCPFCGTIITVKEAITPKENIQDTFDK